ncbi:olfactory receptor 5V1 [Anolis carolinensis]|uniref:Olfactory receptor n=2 Tax=Anolis carolinensis TaxID=28377 RepID=H9GD30_ANOCA|nr:PREDICTED: olfactory receptor 5V1 [Anolis carolinensis]|eukprot:XP_008113683.2 PREDICTED: olfactory receptor 5V1 [Anolis carolinensis]
MRNGTTVTEFILMGISDLPAVRFSLFAVFLLIYLATLLGNGTILLAIGADSHLHNPMYFFLSNLSLLDIFCPTATVPKMLENLLTENRNISFAGCMLQLYFLVALAGTEGFLLAAMAYDRYVAICNPLRYMIIMNKKLCLQMAAGTWITGFLISLLHTMMTSTLPYCNSNIVNQYYCDIPPVLVLSCASTNVAEMVVLIIGGIFGPGAFLVILISYVYIISTILRIRSVEGKYKVFSTCASHLMVVCLFYGTTIFTYVRPSSSHHPDQDRMVSMLYGVITPMMNPFIYSLRNKEVKEALKHMMIYKRH